MRLARGLVECPQEFPLHIARETASLAAALDHLVGDLLGGGCHQIVRLESQFR